MILKNSVLLFFLFLFFSFTTFANDTKAGFGIDVGWGFIDIGAADTAKILQISQVQL